MTDPAQSIKIDNLMREQFVNCHRFFYYRHERGLVLERTEPQWPLEFGIAMHEGLEARFRMLKEGQPVDLEAVVEAFIKAFPEDQPAPMLKRGPGEALYTKVRGAFLLQEYCEHYSEEPFEVLDVEIGAGEELCEGVLYCGRIDALAAFDNGVRAIDHKTSTRLDRLTSNPNNQFMGYQWLASKFYEKCAGIVMDGIGIYKSKPIEDCFDRRYERYNEHQIQKWREETEFVAREILACKASGIWPMNTSHCGAYSGRCMYLPLCTSVSEEGSERLMESMYKVEFWNPYKEEGGEK